MRSRLARALVLCALVGGLVAVVGSPAATAKDDDEHVGYTFGFEFDGAGSVGSSGDVGAARIVLCHFYKVDLDTAALEQIDANGVPCGDGLTFDDDGTLYAYRQTPETGFSGFTQLITIDLHNGNQHVVGFLPSVFVGQGGMTFDKEGDLWLYAGGAKDPQCGATGDSNCLWEVDPDNAHSQFVGAQSRQVTGLAADCEDVIGISQQTLEGLGSGGSVGPAVTPVSSSELDEVNTDNASLHKIASTPGVLFPSGLDFDREGDLYAVGGNLLLGELAARLYEIDPEDGSSTSRLATINGAPFDGVLTGLGIASVKCEEPEAPVPPPAQPTALVVSPTFTG